MTSQVARIDFKDSKNPPHRLRKLRRSTRSIPISIRMELCSLRGAESRRNDSPRASPLSKTRSYGCREDRFAILAKSFRLSSHRYCLRIVPSIVVRDTLSSLVQTSRSRFQSRNTINSSTLFSVRWTWYAAFCPRSGRVNKNKLSSHPLSNADLFFVFTPFSTLYASGSRCERTRHRFTSPRDIIFGSKS